MPHVAYGFSGSNIFPSPVEFLYGFQDSLRLKGFHALGPFMPDIEANQLAVHGLDLRLGLEALTVKDEPVTRLTVDRG